MVFSLSDALSMRLASMKSLYLSIKSLKILKHTQWFDMNAWHCEVCEVCVWLLVLTCLDSPLVKSGSGSFLKKDLSKLLTTLRSCHFCGRQEERQERSQPHFTFCVFVTHPSAFTPLTFLILALLFYYIF